jgi:hypothetical protein
MEAQGVYSLDEFENFSTKWSWSGAHNLFGGSVSRAGPHEMQLFFFLLAQRRACDLLSVQFTLT